MDNFFAEKTDKSFYLFIFCLCLWWGLVGIGVFVAFFAPKEDYLQSAPNIEEYQIRPTFRRHHLVATLHTVTKETTDDLKAPPHQETETDENTDDFPAHPLSRTETVENTDDSQGLPLPKTRVTFGEWQPKPIGYQLQKNETFFLNPQAKPAILSPHFGGTDHQGRDILLRSLASLPIYLIPSFVAIAIALTLGLVLALEGGGFVGESVRFLGLALVDTLDAFPKYMTILLAVVIIPADYRNFKFLGVSCYGFYWLSIVIGVLAAPKIAKLILERIELFWKREFIQATLAMGVPKWKIALVHIVRYNCLPVLTLQMGTLCADVVLIEITLNYITDGSSWGLGVTVPSQDWPSWGNMLVSAKRELQFWWTYLFPIAVSLAWLMTSYGFVYFFNHYLSRQRLKVGP